MEDDNTTERPNELVIRQLFVTKNNQQRSCYQP